MMRTEKDTAFSKRLNYLIESSGISASKIARELKISKQTISSWRMGDRTPKYLAIVSIARYFSVDPEWLLGFGDLESLGKEDHLNELGFVFDGHGEGKYEAGRLGYVMEQKNYSLARLIESCPYIPADDIKDIYEGQLEPTVSQILAFSMVLGIEPTFLLGIRDMPTDVVYYGMENPWEWARELIKKYEAAPELIQEAVCNVLKTSHIITKPKLQPK